MSSDLDLDRREYDEELPGWLETIRRSYHRVYRRILGRYYDPDFVFLSSLLLFVGLLALHGTITGIESSLKILGAVVVLELWILLKLIRSERKWRSSSSSSSRRSPDRGETDPVMLLLGLLFVLLVVAIGPEKAYNELEKIITDLLGPILIVGVLG